jgi:hypothetical protein
MATSVLPVDYGKLLNEARSAYHILMMGQQAKVFVDQNGERIEYTASNSNRLSAYISYLERMCGVNAGSGPMKVWL